MGDPTGLYERISDDREGRELGVTRQHEDLVEEAVKAGDTVVDTYRDNDISASTRSTKRRPEFERLMAEARAGRIKKIRAYTSNRLTRRPRESEDLIDLAEKFNVRILYLRSPSFDLNTSHGRQIARIMAANDAAEAEIIGERAQRRKLQIAQQGGFLGGRRPFGFEADGVTHREIEAAYIKLFAERLLAGDKLAAMAREINAVGLTTTAGNRWRGETIGLLLKRERNAGLVRYQGKEFGEAEWEPIVDVDTWRAVVAVLSDPTRQQHRGNARKHLGASLYLCGVCLDGTTMQSGAVGGGRPGRPNRRTYRCRRVNHLSRDAAAIDDLVERLAVARLLRPDAVDLLTPSLHADEIAQLHGEANATRQRLNELDDELDDGQIDKARWARRNERLKERLAEINGTLASMKTVSALAGLACNPDLPRIWYGEAEDGSDGLPVSQRAAVVDELMTVTLLRARVGRPKGSPSGAPYFNPETVDIAWKVD
jgi:site-specific DNA recombinase